MCDDNLGTMKPIHANHESTKSANLAQPSGQVVGPSCCQTQNPSLSRDDDSVQNTVNWIEKDCTSKPAEYLEESQTNAFGE
jgi:hypothetical protein